MAKTCNEVSDWGWLWLFLYVVTWQLHGAAAAASDRCHLIYIYCLIMFKIQVPQTMKLLILFAWGRRPTQNITQPEFI